MQAVYLDHASTSPIRPEVADVMMMTLQNYTGNPSSIHTFGRESRKVIDDARQTIAVSLQAAIDEIVFTSGGTEADNMAIMGAAMATNRHGGHLITTAIEHHAVLRTCQYLETQGFEVTYLPVDESGRVDVQDVEAAIRPDTFLISIMYGNNEVGTLQPLTAIADLIEDKDILLHTDAVQAYTLSSIDVRPLDVDMLSVTAHKIGGPKGVGCLYIRQGTQLASYIHGGEQERKRRAGTENVAAIAGFAKAVDMAMDRMDERQTFYQSLQDHMLAVFRDEGLGYYVNGAEAERLPHILNIYVPGVSIESLLVNLDLAGIASSSGSACTAGSTEPSHVLTAMFGTSDRGESSIRFSFGYGNTISEVEEAAREIVTVCKRLIHVPKFS